MEDETRYAACNNPQHGLYIVAFCTQMYWSRPFDRIPYGSGNSAVGIPWRRKRSRASMESSIRSGVWSRILTLRSRCTRRLRRLDVDMCTMSLLCRYALFTYATRTFSAPRSSFLEATLFLVELTCMHDSRAPYPRYASFILSVHFPSGLP